MDKPMQRKAVRIVLMRGTLHLVSARDCLALRPLLQPILDRWLMGVVRKQLEGLDIKTLALSSRALVEEQPRTFSELRVLLSEQWPDHPPDALADVVRGLVPLVQVPPRGIWGASGQAAHTESEARETFAKLAEGGTVKYPFQMQPWGAFYGEIQDKFGVMWMFVSQN